MRTAIISDLHLGLTSGGDVLRHPEVRRLLLEEIGEADRVVLLGDAVELRERPLGPSLAAARPFFEDLGAALGEREVTIVPGNHDHRFAEPLLDDLSLDSGDPLSLEQTHAPSPGPTATIDAWLGPARLRIAYPGLWLRDDVYATHGHYMDAHLELPRAECVAVATLIRISGRPIPDRAGAVDYERIMRALYGFSYGVAQARTIRRAAKRAPGNPSETAWKALTSDVRARGRRRQLTRSAIRTSFPAGIWALNRLLHSSFDPDISPPAIFAGGLAAATELAIRLGVDGAHVITGHSHRGGPYPEEADWPLHGGGQLHNTGSWVFASIFHSPGMPPNSYWPGTVTWVEDEGAPRRVRLLMDHLHPQMTELAERVRDDA
ncbi:MAG: metallophosphoesterase family protein [Solirubrobacterales bacterium]|nr:metallophosphoesterase family protein [Solirubrobacterales bacterium]